MNEAIIAETVRWLLDARIEEERGWGPYFRKPASVTVTSEVVLALSAVVLGRTPIEADLLDQIQHVIGQAIIFLRDRLPKHRNPDLPNYALAMLANLHALDGNSDVEFLVNTCLNGMLQFSLDSGGWRTKSTVKNPSTFATCLATMALQELLHVNGSQHLLDSATASHVSDVYDKSRDYLFSGQVHGEDGGWKDCELEGEHSHPAITALVLHVRTNYIQPSAKTSDSAVRRAIRYLCDQQALVFEDWTYRLVQSDYVLFYIPYIVAALSKYLDQLSDQQRRFYYRTVTLLSDQDIRIYREDGFEGCRARSNDQPTVWATAHALAGLCSVPGPIREIRALNSALEKNEQLETERERLGEEVSVLRGKMSDLGEGLPGYSFAGWGRPSANGLWVRISRSFAGCVILVSVLITIIFGVLLSSPVLKWIVFAVLNAVTFYGAYTIAALEPTEKVKSPVYRAMNSAGITVAVDAVALAVGAVQVSIIP